MHSPVQESACVVLRRARWSQQRMPLGPGAAMECEGALCMTRLQVRLYGGRRGLA